MSLEPQILLIVHFALLALGAHAETSELLQLYVIDDPAESPARLIPVGLQRFAFRYTALQYIGFSPKLLFTLILLGSGTVTSAGTCVDLGRPPVKHFSSIFVLWCCQGPPE